MGDARRFVRLYYVDLQRDYPEVWFDPTAGWTFARLLAIADQAWPATPELYRAVRKADLAILERVGLVTLLPNNCYRIKGFEVEREARAAKARASVNHRYGRPTVVEQPNNDGSSRAVGAGSSDTGVITEGGLGETDPVVTYATLTAGWPSPGAVDWIDRLTERFGAIEVIKALGESSRTKKRGEVIGFAQTLLETQGRELAKREKDAEKAKVANRRLDGMLARRLEYHQQTGKWDPAWGEPPRAA